MATERFPRSRRQPQPSSHPRLLQLHPAELPAAEETALEQELLSFDADEDLLSLVAMPPSIPHAARAAITTLIARRFAGVAPELNEQADALETWLYAPHPLLGDACPFERVVAGDALGVLTALVDPPLGLVEALGKSARAPASPSRRMVLTLLR